MKKFSFNLEAVFNLRKDTVKKTQQEMAPVVQRHNELHTAKERILDSLSYSRNHVEQNEVLSIPHGYLRELNELYHAIEAEQKPVNQKLHEWQKVLAEKLKDQRVLELLKKRQYTEWKKAYQKRSDAEQLELVQSFY